MKHPLKNEEFEWSVYYNGNHTKQYDYKIKPFFFPIENSSKEFIFENGKLDKISLKNGKDEVSVDLITGDFFINSICKTTNRFDIRKLTDFNGVPSYDYAFRPIFFRRVRRTFEMSSQTETNIEMVYVIGWQTTIQGKNYKRMLVIYPYKEGILDRFKVLEINEEPQI